jgi:CheY-like chemotaxis protein
VTTASALTLRGTETVLVVEDDDRVRELICTVLDLYGYTVLAAPTGTDALRVSDEHRGAIHLVVTDVVMPELGGRPLADHLARVRPGTKVLYISGYPDDVLRAHDVPGPGTTLLRKPFTPHELLHQARDLMDLPGRS